MRPFLRKKQKKEDRERIENICVCYTPSAMITFSVMYTVAPQGPTHTVETRCNVSLLSEQ